MKAVLALKVDVDTLKGYLDGVPAMLSLLKKHGVRASFYFSFGPDNSGKAIRRIFRKGFVKKMLRTNAPGTYGLTTMMYGTLLPAPLIVPRDPDIFRRAVGEGHECGIHAWDHVAWQDTLDSMPETAMRDDFARAFEMFSSLAGKPPRCCAAPAWKVTGASLGMQDEYGFDYCSDTRGSFPFLPRMGCEAFKTPQVPTTLPTMDEIYGASGIDDGSVNDHYLKLIRPGLSVHTIHAEMEGRSKIHLLEDLVVRCLDAGIFLTPVGESISGSGLAKLPICDVRNLEISGRAGAVAVQSV
ncbi:MAG: polysaccharide deacetylase family protein [Thermovirgaceae bacterium]|nr:polysaccharide deacetylase family protein [Thermovirgaceae bacterium]